MEDSITLISVAIIWGGGRGFNLQRNVALYILIALKNMFVSRSLCSTPAYNEKFRSN